MKILFVSTNDWMPWGGSEELWYKTALMLKKQGHEVYVSVKYWQPIPNHISLLMEAECKVDFRTSPIPTPFYIRAINRIFKKQKKAFSLLDEVRPDIVIINQGSIADGLDWGEACGVRQIKYGYIIQLVNELSVWGDAFVNNLVKILSNAQATFFVSNQSMQLLQAITGTTFINARIIRNPSKENKAIPYPNNESIYKIAFVASLNSFHKGHDMLFEVLKTEKWKQRSLIVNLYGKGPNEETLKRLKELYNLDNVTFCGFVSDLKMIYENNHAFILCSRMEGQSLALIEAMYCGRLPIVTNVGGASELIDDGVNGFIAKSSNLFEIDANLERAWNRRNEWKEMGENAALSVRKVISGDAVEEFSNQILSLINEI